MATRAIRLALLVSLLFLPQVLWGGGGGSLSDGDVTYTRLTYGAQPEASLVGVSSTLTPDFIYKMGWWFRVYGDTKETPFPDPDSESYVANFGQAHWLNLANRGLLKVDEVVNVIDKTTTGHPAALVTIGLNVTNLIATPILLTLFHYADIDINGTGGDDTARFVELTPRKVIEGTDSSGNYLDHGGSGTNVVATVTAQVGEYGTLLSALNDSGLTDYSNGGSPYAGDYAGVVEYSVTVPGSMTVQLTGILTVNYPLHCGLAGIGVFCDGFESGNTSIWGTTQN